MQSHRQAPERRARRLIINTAAQLAKETLIREARANGWQLVGHHPASGKPVFARRPERKEIQS